MRPARGQAQLRRHLGGRHPRRAREDLPFVLDPLARVVVARVDAQLAPPADGEHRSAQHDEGPQRLDLRVGEARAPIEARDRAGDDCEVVGATHEVGEEHRQLGGAPRRGDIAQVDHPVQPTPIAHDVVGGEVAVDHLPRKVGREGVELGGGAAGRRQALLATVLGEVVDELLDDGEGVAELPLQVAVGVLGIHSGQHVGDLGDELTQFFGLGAVGVGDVRQRLPVDDLEPRDASDLPVGADDLRRASAAGGRQHFRCQQSF